VLAQLGVELLTRAKAALHRRRQTILVSPSGAEARPVLLVPVARGLAVLVIERVPTLGALPALIGLAIALTGRLPTLGALPVLIGLNDRAVRIIGDVATLTVRAVGTFRRRIWSGTGRVGSAALRATLCQDRPA
jgi:hypothetical protein